MKRTTIYKPEIYAKVNKENKEILEDYILEMKSKKKSKGTIDQYTYDIKAFFCWIYEEAGNKSILTLKKRIFRNFMLYLQDRNCSAARINRIQCSIRNLLEFACDNEDDYDYEINVMRKIKGLQKEEVRDIIFLKDSEVQAIYDYLMKEQDYQKALYLALSYDSASRRNEVFQVKKEDIDLNLNMTKNKVVGKRGKKFKLFYFDKTKEAYKLYMEQRGEDDIESLWTTGKDEEKRPASYETLYYWCTTLRKIYKELYGVDKDINPHCFRHSQAQNLSDGTSYILKSINKDKFDLKELKVLLNHSDISTTDGYLKNDSEEQVLTAFGLL